MRVISAAVREQGAVYVGVWAGAFLALEMEALDGWDRGAAGMCEGLEQGHVEGAVSLHPGPVGKVPPVLLEATQPLLENGFGWYTGRCLSVRKRGPRAW